MSIKQAVLQALEQGRGESISGEALATALGVSRAAVWKMVKVLQKEGYQISAGTNRGYRLDRSPDRLTAAGIAPLLSPAFSTLRLVVLKEVDSTNLEAKRLALSGSDPCVIISEHQTAGRGRLGRSFYSPSGHGIYTSLLLRPRPDQLADITLLTTATAVAICRALKKVVGVEAQIKWVNDLYLGKKKICGILTEGVTDFESGAIESVVVGFGINFKDDAALPDELSSIVGSVFGKATPTISRNTLAAAMLNELLVLTETLSTRSFMEEYRSRSMLLGQEIVFLRQGERTNAVAEKIDDDGGLIVRLPDGATETLRSGEVSVRALDDAHTLPK